MKITVRSLPLESINCINSYLLGHCLVEHFLGRCLSIESLIRSLSIVVVFEPVQPAHAAG